MIVSEHRRILCEFFRNKLFFFLMIKNCIKVREKEIKEKRLPHDVRSIAFILIVSLVLNLSVISVKKRNFSKICKKKLTMDGS